MKKKIIQALNRYTVAEWEEPYYNINEGLPTIIPLAYTTKEDENSEEEIEIQVSYNMELCELWNMNDGVIIDRYSISHEQFPEFLDNTDFVGLVDDLSWYAQSYKRLDTGGNEK